MLRVYSKVNLTLPSELSVCGLNSKQAVKAAVWSSGVSGEKAALRGERTSTEAQSRFNPNTIKVPAPTNLLGLFMIQQFELGFCFS